MDDRPDSGSHTRALPRRRVGHIANHRLGPKVCDNGSRMGANEGPHLLATRTERLEHMRPHEPTGARDEDRHAGRTLGTVNGANGTNFIFQADANSSLTITSVPEPSTLALLGLGLIAVPLLYRRRKWK